MRYQEIPTDDQVNDCDDLWNAQGLEVGDFLAGCEVKESTVAEWLRATVGLHMDVKHVRGEKVVALRAAPEEWELCA